MKPSLENELLLSVISGEPDECAFEAYCGIREIDFQYGCMLILLAQDKKIELDVADYSRSIERILAGVCSYFCTMTGNSIVIAMILPGELGKDHLKTWAQETALTVVEELEKDKDSNGRRRLAYYAYYIEGDREKAKKYLAEGIKALDARETVMLDVEHDLEEKMLRYLEEQLKANDGNALMP